MAGSLVNGFGAADLVGGVSRQRDLDAALPLTVLPDISPRERGERRRRLGFRQSATLKVSEGGDALPFSPFTGRRCRQADEGQLFKCLGAFLNAGPKPC